GSLRSISRGIEAAFVPNFRRGTQERDELSARRAVDHGESLFGRVDLVPKHPLHESRAADQEGKDDQADQKGPRSDGGVVLASGNDQGFTHGWLPPPREWRFSQKCRVATAAPTRSATPCR